MTTTPKNNYTLSIIIPAYNEELTISHCLDALMQQTVAPDEIIVVDNKSTDATAKIAGAYPGVKIVEEKLAQGITPARNKGLNSATGDILCRIDADTIVPKDWVASMRGYFDAHPSLVHDLHGVAGSADYQIPGPLFLGKIAGLFVFDWTFFPISRMMLGSPTLYGSNMAITKHAWQAVRDIVAVDDSVHEDVDLSACLLSKGGTIAHTKRQRVLVSSRSLIESPRKFLWRVRIWRYSARRARTLTKFS